ncbi:MAG TPA: hypothetical protein VGD78_21925 [Chthoniobacterales bacterium]
MIPFCRWVRALVSPFPPAATGAAHRITVDRARSMPAAFLVGAGLVLCSCASPNAAIRSHYRDYALAVGQPYPEEAAVAQNRVNRYLAHLNPQRRARLEPFAYVAVEATTMPATEVASIAKNMVNSGQVFGSLANDRYNLSGSQALFIMVFDSKTGRPASNEGYVAMDIPQKGQPGLFGGYDALYIGNGR